MAKKKNVLVAADIVMERIAEYQRLEDEIHNRAVDSKNKDTQDFIYVLKEKMRERAADRIAVELAKSIDLNISVLDGEE